MLGRLGWVAGCLLLVSAGVVSAAVVDFEEFALPPYALGPESYWNGSDGSGGFYSEGAFFDNTYTDYGGGFYAWQGWSVSNMTDTTTPGYENQYSANTGVGAGGSVFYGVSYFMNPGDVYIELSAGQSPESLMVTNTTYATLSMQSGDAVAKQFGGASGDDPDWFLLTITGLDELEDPTGTIDFYLADYRFEDHEEDYIIDEWTLVDLTGLADARKLSFALSSSDVGAWGMNTPAYFAMDNFAFVPEPASACLLLVGTAVLARRKRDSTKPQAIARADVRAS